jgi:hypothetical protein
LQFRPGFWFSGFWSWVFGRCWDLEGFSWFVWYETRNSAPRTPHSELRTPNSAPPNS